MFLGLHHARNFGQAYRCAVFPGDDQVGIALCGFQLIIGIDRVKARRAIDIAFGGIGVRLGNRCAQAIQPQTGSGQCSYGGLNTNRRVLTPGMGYESQARYLT